MYVHAGTQTRGTQTRAHRVEGVEHALGLPFDDVDDVGVVGVRDGLPSDAVVLVGDLLGLRYAQRVSQASSVLQI